MRVRSAKCVVVVCLFLLSTVAQAQWINGGTNYYSTSPIGVGNGSAGSAIPLFVAMNGITLAGTGVYNFRVGDATASRGLLMGYDTSGNIGVISTVGSGSAIAFWTHNGSAFGERVRIDGSGNVGIGTSAPGQKLTVAGRGDISTPSDAVAVPALHVVCNGSSALCDGIDAFSFANSGYAMEGIATGTNGVGVYGNATATSGFGVFAVASGTATTAGYFSGNVSVTGSLSKGGGSFKIDHPLDPANKYLYHSFVESPDMKNIYDGIAILDGNGDAIVQMPDWFDALNQDFRYQLTCIHGYAPVYVADEIAGNRFKISGGKAGLKVSWQVTGVRHDAWANAHRIPVEEEKQGNERGRYLHPAELNQPETLGIAWERDRKMRERKQQ
jgi:hypothetical protein